MLMAMTAWTTMIQHYEIILCRVTNVNFPETEPPLICILLSANRDVHFDKGVISLVLYCNKPNQSEPKPQRKTYNFEDIALLCDF